jgi:hypothetical protein
MISVTSSSVAGVGYDSAGLELFVRFHHASRVYVYSGVALSVYERFLEAPSKGQYLAWTIKGQYPYRLVA